MTYVLGINCVYHELSAALIKDGEFVTGIEEERISRIKHGKPALLDNPDMLPIHAIDYCLKAAGITMESVSWIGTSLRPSDRIKNIGADKYYEESGWGTEEGEKKFIEKALRIPVLLEKHYKVPGLAEKFHFLSHHITHSASSFLVSKYEESAIITVDGIGEFASTWIGFGKGTDITTIKEVDYPNSIGFLWEKMSRFLGFSEYDACKVMGLASYGNSNVYAAEFAKIVQLTPDGGFTVDNDIVRFRQENFEPLEALFRTPKINSPAELERIHEDIAAGMQAVTNDVMLHICKYVKDKTGSDNLCLAGGVALNCVSNYEILKSGMFKDIYIQPAAHDGGTALGAAFYIWNTMLKNPRTYVMPDSYSAVAHTEEEILSVIQKEGLKYERHEDIEAKTAELLATGDNIIGWFQGKMEWGPRALGNRTLLADPRNGEMQEILNVRIKRREPFRPFAPSVLIEKADEWFEIPTCTESVSKEYMIYTFPVKKERVGSIPAVTHVDETSRVQLVNPNTNPRYHKLISEFEKHTGIPMVLNTSFNDNEPIVSTPLDAVRTFKRTRMDYLVLHNYLIKQEKEI